MSVTFCITLESAKKNYFNAATRNSLRFISEHNFATPDSMNSKKKCNHFWYVIFVCVIYFRLCGFLSSEIRAQAL